MAAGSNGHKSASARGIQLPKALVFDLDGTLYRQSPVRRAMLIKMALGHVVRPFAGLETMKIIAAYRRAQETLRERGGVHPDLSTAQLNEAAKQVGKPVEKVASTVRKWMEEAPLTLLRPVVRSGVIDLLNWARGKGIQLAVASDYPPSEKLVAMDLHDLFDVAVAAQDPEVGVFKPDPRLLLHACSRLGVEPGDSLYIGDRFEVDGVAAKAAGMRFALITSTEEPLDHGTAFSSYAKLQATLREMAEGVQTADQKLRVL
jgi:FMN phosphatase YigB (HAD superfamily)